MKLIIGIGNPDKKYESTRHNVGIMFVEHEIANSKKQITNKYKLLISDVFMNNSGKFVSSKLNFYKLDINNLYVAHDDLDIHLGEFKIQQGVGPKVHNGISSINENLKDENYWRIRIGIDNRDPQNRINGEEYVLQNFNTQELEILKDVLGEISLELKQHDH